jgi:hypothetical protein
VSIEFRLAIQAFRGVITGFADATIRAIRRLLIVDEGFGIRD